MTRTWIVLIVLVGMFAVPGLARAHEGHEEKITGTVSSVDGNNVMVKTTAGKSVMVMMDAKTKITRGKTKVDATALKVGERIVATGPEEKQMIMAKSVQLPAAPVPAKK